MRLWFGRIQLQRSEGFFSNKRRDLVHPAGMSCGEKNLKTQQSVRCRIPRIKRDGLLAVFLRCGETLRRVASHLVPRSEQSFVGREGGCVFGRLRNKR